MWSDKTEWRLMVVCLFSLLTVFDGWAKDKYDPTTLVFPSFLHTMGIRKATKTHLRLYTRNRVKVNNPQGLAVVRLKSWDDPDSPKDDDEVTGYGINSGGNTIVYNRSMTSLGFYGLSEKGNFALSQPSGVTATADGNVYVADTGNHRIVHFFNPKTQLHFQNAIGSYGHTSGLFDTPFDVAIDVTGHLYVSDTNNHRIQILTSDGKFLKTIGEKGNAAGQLSYPKGIAVTNGPEKWSFYKDRFIVVTDLNGSRIQKFDPDGNLLAVQTLTEIGHTGGKMMFAAIDYYSNIWVTDINHHCIHKFDNNLNYLTSFGKKGKGHKEFIEPRGISIYKRFGQVFVAEKEAAQYYWIGTDITGFTALQNSEIGISVIELQFFLTEPSFLTLLAERNNSGYDTLFERQKYFSGWNKMYLDGSGKRVQKALIESENARQETQIQITPVDQGKYSIKLKVEPTYSSYKYFSKEVETDVFIH